MKGENIHIFWSRNINMVFVIFLILIKVDIPVRNQVILYLYHEIISEITLNNKTYVETLWCLNLSKL
jgi:hypothetical protein